MKIRHKLKATKDRKKRFADLKRVHKEFKVGDHVYLRVRSRKSYLKLGGCVKLTPRYCGPFEVLDRIGPFSYRIAFPTHMNAHNVFHVSLFKRYVHDLNHMIDWNVIQVEPEGEFQVEPLHILSQKVVVLHNRAIMKVKVQWKYFRPYEATWELEDSMRHTHFCSVLKSTEENVVLRGRVLLYPILDPLIPDTRMM